MTAVWAAEDASRCARAAFYIWEKTDGRGSVSLRNSDGMAAGSVNTVWQSVMNRRSCRRYQKRNVPKTVIEDMLAKLANAPNGGNKQLVEYTLVDDTGQMEYFRNTAYREMERLAAQGIYPEGFGKEAYEDMKRWEKTVRPDMLFCGAPHILIPHAPLGQGEPVQDVIIAGTYFELLCASRGLGTVMMTFPLSVLKLMPEINAMLRIPEDHYTGMIIGFGYPQIPYARGTQRTVEQSRIHRLCFREMTGTQAERE